MTDSHCIEISSYRNRKSEEHQILHDAMQFFLDELFKRCIIDHKLNIKVHLKPDLLAEDDSPSQGLAWKHAIKGETWYTIQLDSDAPFLEILSTMAHEAVHVAQFATGRLKNDDEWLWDGKKFGQNPYTGKEVDNELPWEYDAYSKEKDLARKFVKHYYSIW